VAVARRVSETMIAKRRRPADPMLIATPVETTDGTGHAVVNRANPIVRCWTVMEAPELAESNSSAVSRSPNLHSQDGSLRVHDDFEAMCTLSSRTVSIHPLQAFTAHQRLAG